MDLKLQVERYGLEATWRLDESAQKGGGGQSAHKNADDNQTRANVKGCG